VSTAPPFTVDRDLCVGHGRCYALAPEAFAADDMGLGHVRDEQQGELSRGLDSIVNSCPEGAIDALAIAKEDQS
jgi:ferredoxin